MIRKCWILLSLQLVASACALAQPNADLIIHGGTIHTMDATQAAVEVVVVGDGRILYAGSDAGSDTWREGAKQVIDLSGKTMVPGLIESHGHLISLGYSKLSLDLSDTSSYQELIDRVAVAARRAKPGEWILGRGWHQSKWTPQPTPMVGGFQTHTKMSAVSPDNPVLLVHASGHAAIANERAMQIADISVRSEFGEGGEIIKDANGNPTGIFNEVAQGLIGRHIPRNTPESDREALKIALREIAAYGITSFHDAGSARGSIEAYRSLLAQDELTARLWVMVSGRDPGLVEEWLERGPEIGTGNHFLTIRAIKLVADGALGSRGAWLLRPYSDRPDHYGHATVPMATILDVSQRALQAGLQVCVHTIGDRANREVLDRYEQAFGGERRSVRFRIEHAQHLSVEDIPRFGELGVIASMQGIHMSSDRPWAIDRLGRERIEEGAYVWRKLQQTGAIVINGTDVPVEPVNPIASFYALVTRKTLAGTPAGGYEPDQKMTRKQALRSYTLDAAFAAFEEHEKGSIEVGKLADFTVLSNDLLKVPEELILRTRVEMTIGGGTTVYSR